MPFGARTTFLAALATLVLTSCAAMRASTPLPAPVAEGAAVDHRIHIEGWESRDGAVHDWPGYVEPAGPDSLRFVRPAEAPRGIVGGGHAERVVVVARGEVWTLRHPSAAPFVGAAAVVGLAVLVIYVLSLPHTHAAW
jgi:hypothetical protein